MKNTLCKELFDFNIKNQMKISISKNEIYNQLLLYIFDFLESDLILLTSNLHEATKVYNNIRNYIDDIYLFPEDDLLTKKAIASSPELLYMRLKFLNNLKSNKNKKIVICHLNSFIKKLPNYSEYEQNSLKLNIGQEVNRNKLLNQLNKIGYKKDYIVSNAGEFAVRGFVIDIFPIEEEHPVRIEFFGDSIEKVKYFDENTQLSLKDLNTIIIKPITDELNSTECSVVEYFENPFVLIQDFDQIKIAEEHLNNQLRYYQDDKSNFIKFDDNKINNKIYIDTLNNIGNYDVIIKAKETENYNEDFKKFLQEINNHKNSFLITSNEKIINKLKNDDIKIKIIKGYLNKGFEFKDKRYYSENDLKKVESESISKDFYKYGKKINSIDRIKVGDYVVHRENGIGIYMGIKTISKDNIKKDYILIKYKGNDKLYLPVESIDRIYKYSSKEGMKPILHKLNSLEWKKTKLKIKSRIKSITEGLLKIYRKRQIATIEPFDKDNEIQQFFENEFMYEETLDQLKATKEIKKDLESGKPMDRLLCGDVGYGKTEVVFRAIFKTVMNNKQVMYLCPTTILSYQQYLSALDRFKKYAINVEFLNRNKTKKEAREIIDKLKEGKIDVIFGTHRLLSKDIELKNLGLLVIDEEHRFGVEHKEKIKEIKENVHVLSVSATPIPRSLQMSLIGIRDLSIIDTPPKKRFPVQTYVINYNEMLLREVVIKELSRNGQVFILFNKISRIENISKKFSQLIPEAKIRYAHGQINKEEMQDILLKFMNNEFNVLISTTIIENGIDIPNANTIIIIDADKFGLSQLYQIRGRVGRSDRIAYAYLMYDKTKILTETAKKRLEAIKEFTELGSGYKISMRDLSIRGAGDVLGKEQAGFIDSVGIDMYLQLVNEGVNDFEEKIEEKIISTSDISTHIDKTYAEEDEIVIDLHKKIRNINSEEDINKLKKEIRDRFGKIDELLEIYMYQSLFEKHLEKLKLKLFENNNIKISLRINSDLIEKLNMENLFVKASNINQKFKFVYKNKFLLISLIKNNLEKHYLYYLLDLINYIKKEIS